MHELERADESNVRAAASGQRRKLRSFWALAAIGGAAMVLGRAEGLACQAIALIEHISG